MAPGVAPGIATGVAPGIATGVAPGIALGIAPGSVAPAIDPGIAPGIVALGISPDAAPSIPPGAAPNEPLDLGTGTRAAPSGSIGPAEEDEDVGRVAVSAEAAAVAEADGTE
jgi:competence protein ComEA